MKFKPLASPVAEADEGIVFAVQLLDEMLFDYTLDTYKPSVHNASSLVVEAIEVLDLVDAGALDSQHFEEVVAELRSAASQDPLFPTLVVFDWQHLLSDLPTNAVRESKAKLSVLARSLEVERYLRAAGDGLARLAKDPSKKKDIRSYARTFASTLLRVGYTRRYIRNRLDWHFFNQLNPTSGSHQRFLNFLSEFSLKNYDYRVTLAASDGFLEIEATCRDLDFTVEKSIPSSIDVLAQAKLDWPNFKVFLTLDISHVDHFAAARRAEVVMEKVGNLFALFHHKEPLHWSDRIFVTRVGGSDAWTIEQATSPIKRVFDARPPKASQLLHQLVSKFSLEEEGVRSV